MRQHSNLSAIIAEEQSNVQKPEAKLFVEQALLSFYQHSSASPSSVDYDLPLSVKMLANSPSFLIAGQDGNGNLRVRTCSSASQTGFSSFSNSFTPACMRPGWDRSANTLYYARWSWSGNPTIYSASWTGSALGSETSIATIGEIMTNTSALVSRVEAVQHVGACGILVAIGWHNANIKLSTVRFYLVQGSTVYSLSNFIQWHHKDGLALSSWHQSQKWAAHVSAIEIDPGKEFIVVANESPGGSPVMFSWRHGVESSITKPIWIDPTYSSVNFTPTGLCKIGSLYYLSGWFSRPSSDKTQIVHISGYSYSSDGKHWSVGAWNSFVDATKTSGSLVAPLSNSPKIYFVAPGRIYEANARPTDTSASVPVEAGVLKMSIRDQSNGISSLSLAGRSNEIKAGRMLTPYLGYSGNLIQMGKYIIDRTSIGYGEDGIDLITKADALDKASWLAKKWSCPIDLDMWTLTAVDSDMKKPSRLIYKSGLGAVSHTGDGMLLKKINWPAIAYVAGRDERDGVIKARVIFREHDGYALTTFGFVIGGGNDGFNVVVIPMVNNWGGHVVPNVRLLRSNLDPEKKFSITPGTTGLVETALDHQYAKMAVPANVVYTSAHPSSWNAAHSTVYEFACRVFGRDVYVYGRAPVYSSSSIAATSSYVLIGRIRFNQNARKIYDSYWGISCAIDSWCEEGNRMCGEYEDTILSLTDAKEAIDRTQFTRLLATRQRDNINSSRINFPMNSPELANFAAGQVVRLVRPAVFDQKVSVREVGANYVDFALYRTWTPISLPGSGGEDWQIYAIPQLNQIYAYTRSGYVKRSTFDGVVVVTDPPAGKTSVPMIGRGAYISDDSTTFSPRLIHFDGTNTRMISGSHYIDGGGQVGGPGKSGGTFEGFDYTSPLAIPRDWRVFFPHGYFFSGRASQFGLPNTGYFIIDDEIMRYASMAWYRPGAIPGDFGPTQYATMCPSWLAPLYGLPPNSQHLYNVYFPSLNYIAGDDLGRIGQANSEYVEAFSPVGLLVEIYSRNSISHLGGIQPEEEYRVVSVTPGTNLSQASVSYLTIDKPYPNEIIGPGPQGGDIIKVSGRGMLGTRKARHRRTSPLVYYPASTINQPIPWFVKVERLDLFAGSRLTSEEGLRQVCGMIGIDSVSFSSSFTYSGVIGTGINVTPATHDCYIEYVGPIGFGLDFQFRGGIHVQIRGLTTGDVEVRMHAPGAAITPVGGYKQIEYVSIPLSQHDMSSPSAQHRVAFSVSKAVVSVELNGQPLWAFNLEAYPNLDLMSLSGGIRIGSHNGSSWINRTETCTIRVPDVGGEIENLAIDMGMSGDQAISLITRNRHIYIKPTQDGGYMFTNYPSRDNLGTWQNRSFAGEKQEDALNQAGHVVVSGMESADYLDDAWIRENGYSFSMHNNPLLMSPSDNAREAQMIVGLGKRASEPFVASLPGMPQAEIGDRLTITNSYGGSIGTIGQSCIIEGHDIDYRDGEMRSNLTMAKEI